MVLHLLDQRKLPLIEADFCCKTVADVQFAIKNMIVRGAPAIGVTAAFGCVLALHELAPLPKPALDTALHTVLYNLETSRPTAINLHWAIEHMRSIYYSLAHAPVEDILAAFLDAAYNIQAEDIRICETLGQIGASLIPQGATIMTHCNAGALATAGYGTALGVIRAAYAKDPTIKVIANETRPFLQGSRLTCYELMQDGLPVTLACDNACAFLMSKGLVQCCVVGADRIAANGDTANKIGTLGVALLAHHFHIPFYVAAPLSTIDTQVTTGANIPIEERDPNEVKMLGNTPISPLDVPAYNFAFDVTPNEYITGIITEVGVLTAPYDASIAKACLG